MKTVYTWMDRGTGERGFKVFKKKSGVKGWLEYKHKKHRGLTVHVFEAISESIVVVAPDGLQINKIWSR